MEARNETRSLGLYSEVLNVLMESVEEALFIVELRGLRFVEVNETAATLLGYSKSELKTLKADQVFSSRPLRRLVQGRSKSRCESLSLCPKDREPCDLDVTAAKVEYGGQTALVLIARDLDSLHSVKASAYPRERSTRRVDPQGIVKTTLAVPAIVGKSPQIREVCRLIGLVAKTDATVLVQGATGTGKELVARAIHFHSRRAGGSLITVNCAALTDTLLESELFGHKKGAFTGAIQDRQGRFRLADGGTIILDEIGSMSLAGQAKLLRVLQEKEFEPIGESRTVKVDVRVIAISNTDLVQAISEGKFREDLYYRLNAFPIRVPLLKERKIDIPLLAQHFLKQYTTSLRKQIKDFDTTTVARLMEYCWPGNVRELEHVVEYAAILEENNTLTVKSLPERFRPKDNHIYSLKERMELAERQILLEALSQCDWVKNRAAKVLGIDRRNFHYFLNKHNIQGEMKRH